MTVRLERMTAATAAAILSGQRPPDVRVADDYPTEFSAGVASQVASGSELGPYVIISSDDAIVVGELGGAFVNDGTVEVGYAVVRSREGQGLATAAVRELLRRLALLPDVRRVVAHTPLDRPASARVVEKAGFSFVREVDDVHEGQTLRVREWVWAPRRHLLLANNHHTSSKSARYRTTPATPRSPPGTSS